MNMTHRTQVKKHGAYTFQKSVANLIVYKIKSTINWTIHRRCVYQVYIGISPITYGVTSHYFDDGKIVCLNRSLADKNR